MRGLLDEPSVVDQEKRAPVGVDFTCSRTGAAEKEETDNEITDESVNIRMSGNNIGGRRFFGCGTVTETESTRAGAEQEQEVALSGGRVLQSAWRPSSSSRSRLRTQSDGAAVSLESSVRGVESHGLAPHGLALMLRLNAHAAGAWRRFGERGASGDFHLVLV